MRKLHLKLAVFHEVHVINDKNNKSSFETFEHRRIMWTSKYNKNGTNKFIVKFQVLSLKNVASVKIRSWSKMQKNGKIR